MSNNLKLISDSFHDRGGGGGWGVVVMRATAVVVVVAREGHRWRRWGCGRAGGDKDGGDNGIRCADAVVRPGGVDGDDGGWWCGSL